MSKLDPKDPNYMSIVAEAHQHFGDLHVAITELANREDNLSVEETLELMDLRAEKEAMEQTYGLDILSP